MLSFDTSVLPEAMDALIPFSSTEMEMHTNDYGWNLTYTPAC